MNIINNTSGFTVFEFEKVSVALEKMSLNKCGIVFVITQDGELVGAISDGDFRRFATKNQSGTFDLPVIEIANRKPRLAPVNIRASQLLELFEHDVTVMPLVDAKSRLVKIAIKSEDRIYIGNRKFGAGEPVFLIAEIGNNHNGDLKLAYSMIDAAVEAGADCVKFQMRALDQTYRVAKSGFAAEDLGAQYTRNLLDRFQLPVSSMLELFDYCQEVGTIPLCTPWDEASLEVLVDYGMEAFKVASADLTNHDFITKLCQTGRPLILSTGMSHEAEIVDTVGLLQHLGAKYALLHCNSTYPAPFKDINLSYMQRLKEIGGDCIVGYSGHERGINVSIAAATLGASVIEKHFTLDRKMEGNDHRVSLLPHEFRDMVEGVRQIQLAVGNRHRRTVSQGELINRETLAKSLVAKRTIKIGEQFTSENVEIRSPGQGLAPYHLKDLLKKLAPRSIEIGDFIYESDLTGTGLEECYKFQFNRPFGVPVRFHDFEKMINVVNLDLVEFHLSYADLDLDYAAFMSRESYSVGLAVHAPELFAKDHILDLSTPDEDYRKHSITELQRVIELTRSLKGRFPETPRPVIIVNAGGFSADTFLEPEEKQRRYRIVADSLGRLDRDGIELIFQTMPPYPWHFGGQRYHNLFVSGEEISDFCAKTDTRICLDVSHSKLACNEIGASFEKFLFQIAPFVAHLHLADAAGEDGEGLQIGDGEMDFYTLCRFLNEVCPNASFIPEIWQGHKDGGRGFWFALGKLQVYFNQ